jgi:N-acetylglucosaminyl-diphospho-decaprenol L-rhamnosyltransferase
LVVVDNPVPDLTVSIVNHNHRDLLRDCLRSIFAGSRLALEVFVVDYRSTDGSRAMVRAEFPQTTLIEVNELAGYSANHNRALRRARGRHVAVLNDDLVVYPGALDQLVAYLDAHPQVAAVGPQVVQTDGHTVQLESGRCFPTLWTECCRIAGLDRRFPHSVLLGGVNLGHWSHADTRQVDCLLGACMVVRAEALAHVGLMDEGYFMYGEDVDWPYRLRQIGWQIVFVHNARVLHYGGQSTQHRPLWLTVEALRSQYRFFYKHYGRNYAAAYRALVLGVEAAKQIIFLVRWLATRNASARAGLWRHTQVFRWFLDDPARPVAAEASWDCTESGER